MSTETKVDVLAVMEKAAKELRHWQRDHGEDIRTKEALAGLRQSHDAVAELIEASKYFKFEVARIANSYARKKAEERLEAALARVGGAS